MNNSGDTDATLMFGSKEIQELCPMFDKVMTLFYEKTNGERLPRRSDFAPVELIKYLPNIFLLDLKYDESGIVDDAFCQVCGTLCVTIYGELTGTWLSTHKVQEIYLRTRDRWRIMVERRQACAITTQVLSKDKNYLFVRALYIPLSEDGITIEKVITFIEYDTTPNAQNISY